MRRTKTTHRLTPEPERPVPADLRALGDRLLEELARLAPWAREGAVRGRRPGIYRRVDCDGRALIYLRPRRRGVRGLRVDLSGLWVRPRKSPIEISGRSGSASLLVTDAAEIPEAARFVAEAIVTTRRLLDAEARRRPPTHAGRRADSGVGRP